MYGKNHPKLQPMHQSLLVSVVRNENEMNQTQVAECDMAQKLCSCRHVIAYYIWYIHISELVVRYSGLWRFSQLSLSLHRDNAGSVALINLIYSLWFWFWLWLWLWLWPGFLHLFVTLERVKDIRCPLALFPAYETRIFNVIWNFFRV